MADLQEIDDYISEKLMNPDAAKRIIAAIAQDASLLKSNPSLGFELSRKTGRVIKGRGLVSGRYLIIYDIDDCISILRILDTRGDFLKRIGTW